MNLENLAKRKQQAEALRFGLMFGHVNARDVVAWADAIIEADDQPSSEIIDLALAGSQSATDIAKALEAIPGTASPEPVAAAILRQMAAALLRDPSIGLRIVR